MAITTIDGALSGSLPPIEFVKAGVGGVAGRPISTFYTAGRPAAATAPTPGIGGAALTSYTGQIPFTNPGSGNTYLSKLQAQSSSAGLLLLCDRLWHNSGITITITTEQTFTSSVQIPARDINGTNNGVGVYGAVEVSSATGAGTPTLTLKYTNSGGTADKTATNVIATAATSAIGTFYPIGLAAGDVGIQKAQSLTLSTTWTSGTIHVVLYRIIAILEIPVANRESAIDMLNSGFPKLYNDSVPFYVYIPATATTAFTSGKITLARG